MNKIPTDLEGVFVLEPRIFTDDRGLFIKTHNHAVFADLGLDFELKESYYSLSRKGVIRGMHFQTPPHDHVKIVYVTAGLITDVIVDIRKNSPTFGKHISLELSAANRRIVYIPRGFAHGFLARKDNSCVVYNQSTGYAPDNDTGIRFDSFGKKWGVRKPILSERDKAFPTFEAFESPFVL